MRAPQEQLGDAAVTDLFVFAVGHEIAAVKLCGQAASQCSDTTGRMLLVDLALARLESHSPAAAVLPPRTVRGTDGVMN